MSDVLLTVVIPTYQRQADLQRALESLQQPQCERIEVVISDNASTDGTEEYARQVKLPFAKNYLRNPENVGILRNFYQASQAVQTDYQLWLTDDDYLIDGGLAKLLDGIDKNPDCGYFFSHVCSIAEGCAQDDIRWLLGPSHSNFRCEPSLEAVANYTRYGWVYSRQTLRTDLIDWAFWQRHMMNAYVPAVIGGQMLLKHPSFYHAENIVAHTVGNATHWSEFGDDEISIALRTHADLREVMAAVLDEVPETVESRLMIERWERGCDELCYGHLQKQIESLPANEVYRAFRRQYKASPEVARRLTLRSSNLLARKYHRFIGKKKWMPFVQINDLHRTKR